MTQTPPSTLESHLWEAANILHGSPVDRSDWKSYTLPLMFIKRICDVWDEEYEEAVKLYGKDFANERFKVPEENHWNDVREGPSNIETALQNAVRGIDAANQKHLYGIFSYSQWTNKDRPPDALLIVVDVFDLDAQISATFLASDIPNLFQATSRTKLETLLTSSTCKINLTTIFKFGKSDGVLNERVNIIMLVDEAYRSQEGDLGMKMRAALPKAFFFGLTGTPINHHNATLPLHFEPRLVELHIDKIAIDRGTLSKAATKMAVLVKVPERIEKICADVAHHFQEKVKPNGFKAMLVTYDQEGCLHYKAALDKHLSPEPSNIVISVSGNNPRYTPYKRDRDNEEKLLDRYRDPNDPLQIIIVTAKLLTGFDVPILQAMYLDKPVRDHTLLQAITRTNRKGATPHAREI